MTSVWTESIGVFTVSLLLYCAARAEGATSCEVRKTEGNTTYLDTTLCEHGCCREDDLTNKCCDPSPISQGIVLGIVIVVSLVVMAFCIYIRLKIALHAPKPQTRSPPDPEPSPEANPEIDPPPSYWTCVSEAPPQYVPSTSSVVNSSDSNSPRVSSSDIVHPAVHAINEEDDQHPLSGAASVTSEDVQTNVCCSMTPTCVVSERSMHCSTGIVLQPSSFHISSISSPSVFGSVQQTSESSELSSSVKEGSVVMFVPGQLSSDACQSMLQDYGGSQVIICKAGENNSTSECFAQISSNLADRLSHSTSTESAELESSTITPTTIISPSGFDQSSLSEILNRMSSGSVVIFAKTDTNVPRD